MTCISGVKKHRKTMNSPSDSTPFQYVSSILHFMMHCKVYMWYTCSSNNETNTSSTKLYRYIKRTNCGIFRMYGGSPPRAHKFTSLTKLNFERVSFVTETRNQCINKIASPWISKIPTLHKNLPPQNLNTSTVIHKMFYLCNEDKGHHLKLVSDIALVPCNVVSETF